MVKRDGRREAFQREKLRAGLARASAKRAVPQDALEVIISAIERRVRQSETAEIESRQLGEWVIERLNSVDPVAGFRFATVFRRPADLDAIRRELAAADQATLRRSASPEEWDQPTLPGLAPSAAAASSLQRSPQRDRRRSRGAS